VVVPRVAAPAERCLTRVSDDLVERSRALWGSIVLVVLVHLDAHASGPRLWSCLWPASLGTENVTSASAMSSFTTLRTAFMIAIATLLEGPSVSLAVRVALDGARDAEKPLASRGLFAALDAKPLSCAPVSRDVVSAQTHSMPTRLLDNATLCSSAGCGCYFLLSYRTVVASNRVGMTHSMPAASNERLRSSRRVHALGWCGQLDDGIRRELCQHVKLVGGQCRGDIRRSSLHGWSLAW